MITVHKRTARRVLAAMAAGAVLAGTGTTWAAEAHADRYHTAICATLDSYPSVGGVAGVGAGLMDQGFTPYDAGRKIAEAVAVWCPEHMPEVQAFIAVTAPESAAA